MLQLPQQINQVDCGIFLLEYAKRFIKSPLAFQNASQTNINYSSWFNLDEISNKRYELCNIILQISQKVDWDKVNEKEVALLNMPLPESIERPKRTRKKNSLLNDYEL